MATLRRPPVAPPVHGVPAPLHGGPLALLRFMRGHGMPTVRGTQRGDHIVTVHVEIPGKISNRQRELLEQYAELGGDRIQEKSFFDKVKDAFRPE